MIRGSLDLVKDHAGAAALEFAFLAPVLLVLMVGMAQFGITLNNYLTLTNAVSTGSRLFAISRGGATPRSSTVTQIQNAALNLTPASLTITISVNGTACATDSACTTALSSNAGNPSTVTASYPCNLTVMAINYAPGCTLSTTTTERIQ